MPDTASEQRIERERVQASEAARRAEQIKQSQQQLETAKATAAPGGQQQVGPASSAAAAPEPAPASTGRVSA